MTAHVIRAGAEHLPLADNSVDLIVTSPPYFGLRSYQDGGKHYDGQVGSEHTPGEFLDVLIACTREWMRVVKPSGSIFVNLGDKYGGRGGGPQGDGERAGRAQAQTYAERRFTGGRDKSLMGLPWRYAIRCIDELGLILRAEVVWSKPNGLPESVTDRVRRSHEQWFHFTLSPRYFSAVDEIREPHTSPVVLGRRHVGASFDASGRIGSADGSRHTDANPLGKLPGSVWTIPTEPLTLPDVSPLDGRPLSDHFAAFPMEWPRRIVKAWSPSDGVVLDPFGGTGTVALVASVLGRTGITVDLSHDYCRLARWRTSDRGQIAKAMQVERPEPVMQGQANLFGESA